MTTLDDVPQADLALVADAREGQRDAFAELYRRHHAPAFRYALSLTRGDEALAQDIVAEAFARVLRATFQGGGSTVAFRPYLLSAIRHEFLAEQRRFGRIDLVDDEDELDSPTRDDEAPDDGADPVVVSAFSRLPARWRAVLWHMEVQGDKPADLARFMGISANAVAALASRAREGLRQEYLQEQVERRRPECQPYASRLGRLVRGGLTRRERRRLEGHLDRCADCARARAELARFNLRLRSGLPVLGGAGPLLIGHGLPFGAASGAAGSGAVPAGAAVSAAAPAGVAATGVTASGCVGSVGATGTGALAGAAVLAPVSAGVAGMAPVGMAAGLAIASAAAVLGLSGIKSPADAASAPVPATVAIVSNETTGDSGASASGPVDPNAEQDEGAGLDVREEGLAEGSAESPADEPAAGPVEAAAVPSAPDAALAGRSAANPLPTGAPVATATPESAARPDTPKSAGESAVPTSAPSGPPGHATRAEGPGASASASEPGTGSWKTSAPTGKPQWSKGNSEPRGVGSTSDQHSATSGSPDAGAATAGLGVQGKPGRHAKAESKGNPGWHAKAESKGNAESTASPGSEAITAGSADSPEPSGNPEPPATPPGKHARR